MSIGRIISISDLLAEAFLTEGRLSRRDMVYAEDGGRTYRFEVQDIHGKVASLIPFDGCRGLHRGAELFRSPAGLEIEYSDAVLGRVFNRRMDNKAVDKLFLVLMVIIMLISLYNAWQYTAA